VSKQFAKGNTDTTTYETPTNGKEIETNQLKSPKIDKSGNTGDDKNKQTKIKLPVSGSKVSTSLSNTMPIPKNVSNQEVKSFSRSTSAENLLLSKETESLLPKKPGHDKNSEKASPKNHRDVKLPLPENWEMRKDESGRVRFNLTNKNYVIVKSVIN